MKNGERSSARQSRVQGQKETIFTMKESDENQLLSQILSILELSRIMMSSKAMTRTDGM